jgi:hypothetical protein
MATDAIHMFSTRHIPDLYYRREFAELDSLLDSVAGVTLAVIAAGMIAILGGGHWLLMAFSAAYLPYYGALALLSFGMAAVAAAGPSGSILMLTGHEGRYLFIIGLTVLIRTIGFFVLIPPFGVTGAVIGEECRGYRRIGAAATDAVSITGPGARGIAASITRMSTVAARP